MSTEIATSAQHLLIHTLERLGWSLSSAEVNLVANTARVELRRTDGLLVTLDARNGRASITRERVRVETELRGRKSDRYRAEFIRVEFIGRTRYDGIRSAMRSLCNYVEDNAVAPALRFTVRPAFAALLG